MKQLMYKIMLTCRKATFYSSIKSFQRLPFVRRVQLKMHLMMCKGCHEFDHYSQIIDKSLADFNQNESIQSKETLSKEKLATIQETVDQHIK